MQKQKVNGEKEKVFWGIQTVSQAAFLNSENKKCFDLRLTDIISV